MGLFYFSLFVAMVSMYIDWWLIDIFLRYYFFFEFWRARVYGTTKPLLLFFTPLSWGCRESQCSKTPFLKKNKKLLYIERRHDMWMLFFYLITGLLNLYIHSVRIYFYLLPSFLLLIKTVVNWKRASFFFTHNIVLYCLNFFF